MTGKPIQVCSFPNYIIRIFVIIRQAGIKPIVSQWHVHSHNRAMIFQARGCRANVNTNRIPSHRCSWQISNSERRTCWNDRQEDQGATNNVSSLISGRRRSHVWSRVRSLANYATDSLFVYRFARCARLFRV